MIYLDYNNMPHIKLFVDDKEISPGLVTMHYQKISKPGGHNFKIIIPLSNADIVQKLEKLTGTDINTIQFAQKIVTREYSDFLSIVINILGLQMEEKNKGIQWVLNNFNNVYIKDNNIYIIGLCSQFERMYL